MLQSLISIHGHIMRFVTAPSGHTQTYDTFSQNIMEIFSFMNIIIINSNLKKSVLMRMVSDSGEVINESAHTLL